MKRENGSFCGGDAGDDHQSPVTVNFGCTKCDGSVQPVRFNLSLRRGNDLFITLLRLQLSPALPRFSECVNSFAP